MRPSNGRFLGRMGVMQDITFLLIDYKGTKDFSEKQIFL